ncbi:MAG TPA: hypothetical protein VF826_10915 [Chloroflexia bacterium]|jgi:hypothetical protein
MKHIDREQLVLLVLALANGRHFSRTQLQKAVFQLQEELPSHLFSAPKFQFRADNFGMFTEAVYQVAEGLADKGLANLGDLSTKDGFPTSYAASQNGIEVAQDIIERMPKQVATEAQYKINHLLEQQINELLEDMYSRYPGYATKSKVRRNHKGRIMSSFGPKPVESLLREDTGIPHTPPHDALRTIRALTELPYTAIAQLLNVSSESLKSWYEGAEIPEEQVPYILAVQDVLRRAEKRYPTSRQMRAWLNIPIGNNGINPTDLLSSGDFNRARFYAVSTPSIGLMLSPPVLREPVPEEFLSGAEHIREASLPDSEDDLLSSRERHKAIR